VRRAILLTVAGSLLALPAPSAADHTVAESAQLDADPELERVERRFTACPEGINAPTGPDQCGSVAVVDGDVTTRLTPPDQRPRYDYGWAPYNPVVLRDLTGDGIPEIIWRLSTAGGTGSSPVMMGVHRWTGAAATRIFRTRTRVRRNGWSQPVALKPGRVRKGLRELVLRELLYAPRDSTCCPSFVRTRRLRWNGTRMRVVPGSERLRAA
jgi:hypothetical protein